MSAPDKRYGFNVARASGEWFFPIGGATGGIIANPAGSANNEGRVLPWICDSAFFLTQIQMDVTVVGDAGSTLRPIIYADNGSGFPGVLVLDAGTMLSDAIATPTVTLVTPLQMFAGVLYWIGAITQGAATTRPTIRVPNAQGLPFAIRLASAPSAGLTPSGFIMSSITSNAPLQWTGILTQTANYGARLAFRVA